MKMSPNLAIFESLFFFFEIKKVYKLEESSFWVSGNYKSKFFRPTVSEFSLFWTQIWVPIVDALKALLINKETYIRSKILQF